MISNKSSAHKVRNFLQVHNPVRIWKEQENEYGFEPGIPYVLTEILS